MNSHPHYGQVILSTGESLTNATSAMIMIHGRGGSAEDILAMSNHFTTPNVAYFAPQAKNFTWYPNRFIMPRASNEPYLTSAMRVISDLILHITENGLSTEKIMLIGFSQGACLVSEYAVRNPKRYGGVFALSGGLIGADGELTGYIGSLSNTPVFLGCSDVDDHIPVGRIHESEKIFIGMNATVTKRIYPNMGHTINQDELDFIKGVMSAV
jgi:predicted esterase